MDPQNPTAGNSGASTPDPLDRIQAYLDADSGEETSAEDTGSPASNATNASKTPDKSDEGDEGSREPQFTTSHLAQFLGIDESMVDVDEEGQPVFKTKIDGKESAAKFQDFLKDYQLKGHAENRAREAAEKEKAAERRMQEAEQAIQQRLAEQQQNLQSVAQLAALAQQELEGEYKSINWAALAQQDAGQAFALKQRFEERQQRINGLFGELQRRNQHAKQEAERLSQENQQKQERQQRERLLNLIPEWKDPSVFAKEREELLGWAERTGFDHSELDLNRAAHVYLLRRSWQHDTLQSAKSVVEKQVRTAPKLVKPGQAPQPEQAQAATLKSLKQQMKAPGKAGAKAVEAWLLQKGIA